MIDRRALLAGGLAGAAGTLLDAAPVEAAGVTELGIQHSSLQFSDSLRAHEHDARAVFAHARATGNVLVSGTESSGGNSLHREVPRAAQGAGYALHNGPGGTWVAVDRRFATVVSRGFVPVFPALGRPARDGGHGEVGIVWIRVRPRDRRVAPTVVYGASHWLTRRSLRASGLSSNRRLARAVDRWAIRKGRGSALVFYGADTNTDDRRRDLFAGGPLTTCWDELGKWPGTRYPRGSTIDVVASRDWDDRVSCRRARRLLDSDLHLFSDHYTIEAGYRVRLRP